jgi:GTP-binding protein
LRERSNLKAVVVILDIRREASSGDTDLLSWLKHYGIHAIPVLTKADKLSRQKARTRAIVITRKLKDISPIDTIVFSAKTKVGKEEIWDKIRQVSGSDLQVPR